MRCLDCNAELTDFEATRYDVTNHRYLDLCNVCYSPISGQLKVKERWDLYEKGEFDKGGDCGESEADMQSLSDNDQAEEI